MDTRRCQKLLLSATLFEQTIEGHAFDLRDVQVGVGFGDLSSDLLGNQALHNVFEVNAKSARDLAFACLLFPDMAIDTGQTSIPCRLAMRMHNDLANVGCGRINYLQWQVRLYRTTHAAAVRTHNGAANAAFLAHMHVEGLDMRFEVELGKVRLSALR